MRLITALALLIILTIAAVCLVTGETIQGIGFLFVAWVSSVGIRMMEVESWMNNIEKKL